MVRLTRRGLLAPRAYALGSGLLAVAYFALPPSVARAVLWGVLALAPVPAVLLGIRLYRPARPLPWLLIAASQVTFAAGDAILDVADLTGRELSSPSIADVCYLLIYPFLAAGLIIVVRRRTPGGDAAALLDGSIFTVGLGIVSWVFLAEPTLSAAADGWVSRSIAVAYPLGDLLVLAVAARLWSDRGRRGPAFGLLVCGLVALLAADTGYALQQLAGDPSANETWSDIGWLFYFASLGSAALHPSMRDLDHPAPRGVLKITRVRFGVLLAVAALLPPAVIAVQATRGGWLSIPLIGGVGCVLFTLVLIRMSGLVVALRDLHKRQSDDRFHRLTRYSADVIGVCDPDGTVRYITPSIERVYGWRPEGVLDTALLELIHADDRDRLRAVIGAVRERAERAQHGTGAGAPAPLCARLRTQTGEWITSEIVVTWLDDGDMRGYLITARDITDRVGLEEQLTHQAFHDSLTGLANRALFLERVRHGLERRSAIFRHLAVLLLDLDDFKTVNDSLGPDAGDELLRCVAERLRGCLRAADTAARLGGDEFGLLVEDIGDPAEAAQVAVRVLDALQAPIHVLGRDVVVRASVGIAVADPDTVPDAGELLRNADVAMYTAKQQGKNRYDFFAPSMHTGLVRRLDLTAELREAVGAHQMEVFYQPVVELPDGALTGVEALVRWRHPDRGLVAPNEFIPLAEETGLIVPLGADVLRQACVQMATWRRAAPDLDLSVGVNLSPRQVQDPDVVGLVREALAASGLPPDALILEITESVLAEDSLVAVERLAGLKDLGVRLAVDDFGTGYSSLSRLHHMPIDILKIPKPFVDGVAEGPAAGALARAIVELSAALGLAVVAEGIEHEEQARVLYDLGCRQAQGYHFGRPVPADEITARLPAAAAVGAGGAAGMAAPGRKVDARLGISG
jgi:diguanylate cyclase (GGDEF)-like protein/PAS domain S-box-containing protein